MGDCVAVNIQDMLKAIGEERVSRLLSDFSCPLLTCRIFKHDPRCG